MPQEPIQPDPALVEFNRLVAMKAVIDTFVELIESCYKAEAGTGVIRCIICESVIGKMGEEECHPVCARLRAERALAFLVGKGVNGG